MKKMTKTITLFSIIIMIVSLFNSCAKNASDEDLLIYYDNKYYNSSISNDYTYNSFWYPLSDADIIDTAYACNKEDDVNKLGKKDKVEIKKYSDEELNMFILHTDFWDDWLFCDENYKFPSLSAENIEAIALKKFSEDKEWADYYNSDDCITIQNNDEIYSIINSLTNINKSSESQSFNMNEVSEESEICVKFKGINALYYLGIVAYANENVVFYDAHTKQSIFYLLYDENTSNPFDTLNRN